MAKPSGRKLKYADLAEGARSDFRKIGKVTTESVFKGSGRHWDEWVALLNKAGARSWSHAEIVSFLKRKHKLGPWWQQGVTSGYEVAIGRRAEGQDAKGKYMVTATKSLPRGAAAVWNFLLSRAGLDVWLQPLSPVQIRPKTSFETKDGFYGEVRTVARGRRARLQWNDPEREERTTVEVMLVGKPGGKSILVFNHTGIGDTKTREQFRSRWRKAADELGQLFSRRE